MLWLSLRQLKSSKARTRRDAAMKLGESGNTKAVEPLITALKDFDKNVRQYAAYGLGKIGDAQAVEPLIVALMDSHEDVRYSALQALKALKYEPADEKRQAMMFVANKEWDNAIRLGAVAVESLIAALKDGNDEVRCRVAEALGEIGDVSAVPALTGALKDSYKYLHWRAAEALGKIGDVSAVPALVAALKDSDHDARLMAAVALVEIGDASAVPALVAALKDGDKHVRRSAAEAMGRVGRSAAEMSGNIGEPAVSALVAALVAALKDSDSDVRWSAAIALGWIGDVSAVPALIAALGSDRHLCEKATEALVKIGNPAVPALIDALQNENVRYSALQALKALGYEPADETQQAMMLVANKEWDNAVDLGAVAVNPFIAALKDSDKEVQLRAVKALGKIGDPAVEPLIVALRDSDKRVRLGAVMALGKIGDARAVEPLLVALEDADWYARVAAIVALGEIGDARAVEPLILTLKDSEDVVRRAAAMALGEIGDGSATESLVSCLESERSNDVQSAIVTALEKLGWAPSKPARHLLWALNDFPGVGKTVTCSADCSRVGLVRSLGDPEKGFDAEYAVVDGRSYPKARRITPNAQIPVVQFSSDGKLWGYSAADDEGNEFVVINGSESHHYSALVHPSFLLDLSLSEVGGHYAFGARRQDAAFYVINGHETDPADDVDDFRWTRDGSRCLFTEQRGDLKRLVVDDSAGPSYADISFPWFSQDGRTFAYKAHVGGHVVAVADHIEVGDPCEALESLRCGPETFGVCYWAKNGEFAELCVGGKPSGARIRVTGSDHSTYNWQIEFSLDGRHIAAAATSEYGKHTVFQDNQSLGCFGNIGNLAYDSANRLLFLAGPSYKECYLHIDGKPASDDCGFAEFLHAAPVGGRYCFQSFRDDSSSLVVEGRRSKLIYAGSADFRLLKFSPAGKHVSYVGKRGPHEYIAADDLECGPFDMVAGTFFSDEDVLIGIVVKDGVVERLEWRLDNPQ